MATTRGNKQMNFRLSADAGRKLDELTPMFGTKSKVIEIAIDRLYQSQRAELARQDAMRRLINDPEFEGEIPGFPRTTPRGLYGAPKKEDTDAQQ